MNQPSVKSIIQPVYLTLKVCDTLEIHEMIITCGKSNVVSANVIQNFMGEFEAEFYNETYEEIIQRYLIKR